jgi:hypothetical protein
VPRVDRNLLHEDHNEMLDAFLSRDVDRLLATAAVHHGRLNTVVSTLSLDSGVIVESPED